MTPTEPKGGEPCGGCGEHDPSKACLGCLHFHAPARPPVVHGWPEREAVRQRITEIVEAAIERHAPANSVRHTLDDADAILSLFPPVVGWRMVPVEPTEAMLDAMFAAYCQSDGSYREAYRAMLAAAPLTDGVGE